MADVDYFGGRVFTACVKLACPRAGPSLSDSRLASASWRIPGSDAGHVQASPCHLHSEYRKVGTFWYLSPQPPIRDVSFGDQSASPCLAIRVICTKKLMAADRLSQAFLADLPLSESDSSCNVDFRTPPEFWSMCDLVSIRYIAVVSFNISCVARFCTFLLRIAGTKVLSRTTWNQFCGERTELTYELS